MLHLSSPEDVFFSFLDTEEAREGVRWSTPPPLVELAKRYVDFRSYLDHSSLSAEERQALLETYEGYLLVKYAFSGLPQSSARSTAN